ncbi:MAG: PLD nuclease N-terminal domain-containing protein [Chloroflexota bacterium]
MDGTADTLRALLIVCHVGMAVIALLYLRKRRLPLAGKLFWAAFSLFIPYIGPFAALLWRDKRNEVEGEESR